MLAAGGRANSSVKLFGLAAALLLLVVLGCPVAEVLGFGADVVVADEVAGPFVAELVPSSGQPSSDIASNKDAQSGRK